MCRLYLRFSLQSRPYACNARITLVRARLSTCDISDLLLDSGEPVRPTINAANDREKRKETAKEGYRETARGSPPPLHSPILLFFNAK